MVLNFDKIILMGSKTTAYRCAEVVAKKAGNVHCYENVAEKESIPSLYLNNPSITWHFCSNNEWKDLLKQEKEKTLFLSVTNQSIIPKEIISINNITLINLHSAILPYYRGRNCGGWALFNEEKFTGSTWHYLTEKVDEGNILWQREVLIAENDTSFSLLRKQYNAGVQLLEENIERLLHEDIAGIPQSHNEKIFYSYAKDKPNDGFLDLNWSGKKISCFLRAMDYGPLYEFGVPKIEIDNKKAYITAYKIEKSQNNNSSKNIFFESDNKIIIESDNYKFILNINEY